jgi:hypothetical protein
VVECTALEMRHTGNRIEGSNPSLSATSVKNVTIDGPYIGGKRITSAQQAVIAVSGDVSELTFR